MRILISGGPGAGCTSTAEFLGNRLDLPVFDSDVFYHKPTNPPFQEQHSPDERKRLLTAALSSKSNWIISGSIATWDIDLPPIAFGIFIDLPSKERLGRLAIRERERFGKRIDQGGDLHEEHEHFMLWASGYENRSGFGRNRDTDREFLVQKCDQLMEITQPLSFESISSQILHFLKTAKT
ncbi:MAG: adenylate kinase [Akkermansiaceae bacterium]